MLVIFEGLDKTGKTTLIGEVNKATGFKHIVLDRFAVSSIVYSKLLNRGYEQMYYDILNVVKQTNVMMVYCYTDKETWENRVTQYDEKLPHLRSDFNKLNDMFLSEIIRSGIETLFVDTTKPIEECVKTIVAHIEHRSVKDE